MAAVGDIGEGLIVVVEQRLLSGILAGKWGEHSTCLAFAQLPLLSPPFPPPMLYIYILERIPGQK